MEPTPPPRAATAGATGVRTAARPRASPAAITLVLLPGMDGTGQLFAPFLAALGSEFKTKVVAYPVDRPLGYAELELLVRAAIPARGPYVILGESFSGPIAVSIAASGAARLKGLVLCCSFVRGPLPVLPGMGSVLGWLPVTAAPVLLMEQVLLGRFSTPALRAALARTMAQVSAPTIRARMLAALSVDVSAKLAALRLPMLYLRARHDRLVSPGAAALAARLNPALQMVDLPAPHFLLQAAPQEAAQTVAGFLRGLAVTPPARPKRPHSGAAPA